MTLLRNKGSKDNKAFMQEVENHERSWGIESYQGRPKLEQILASKIVAFWYPSGVDDDMHTVVTLHSDLTAIDEYITHLVWHSKTKLPSMRLAKVFRNQQEVKIKAVNVVFEKA